MSWSLKSPDGLRWLEYQGDSWTADPETTFLASDPEFRFLFTPTGPSAPITDESSLYSGAVWIIGRSVGSRNVIEEGDLPKPATYSGLPSSTEAGLVY